MQHIAHKLSGASSYCGTENLTQASKTLDKCCRGNHDQTEVDIAAQQLITAIDELMALSMENTLLLTLRDA